MQKDNELIFLVKVILEIIDDNDIAEIVRNISNEYDDLTDVQDRHSFGKYVKQLRDLLDEK